MMSIHRPCFTLLIFWLLFTGSFSLYAQREAANWYFGAEAGLSFVDGTPQPLLDGVLDTTEGCESLSDANGNLLFYTDGKTVWNRQHEPMPNGTGLLGSFSSTQSAMAIPQPGSNNIYYLFTTDDVQAYQTNGTGNGFNYSVIDMSRNGGLGDVIQKNISLLPDGSEKVTAVSKSNGDDFWVITHFQDRFYAYSVTASGVNTSPVVTQIGPTISDFNNIRGGIKSSPIGDRIAIAHAIFEPFFRGELYLYDLDRDTGILSNQRLLDDKLVYYGAEFSSNSKKLYASGKEVDPDTGNTTNILVEQFDLEAADIPGSMFTQAVLPNTFQSSLAGTLQIAVNKKIYHAIPGLALSVINSPNNYGLDADFRKFEVSLAGRLTKFGLPPFIQSYFESIVSIQNFCQGDTTEFMIDTLEPIDSILWNFGDPASGANNTSTLLEPSHVYTTSGLFTVTIDVEFTAGISRRFLEYVEISETPDVNPSTTLVQCDIDGQDDGISVFNLNQSLADLLPNPIGFTANFFESLAEAIDNENNLEPVGYVNQFNGQKIYARVFKDALCYEIAEVILEVEPMSNAGTMEVSVCNRSNNPLNTEIDLADLEEILQETYPGTTITFYEEANDALLEQNRLQDVYQVGPFSEPEVYYRVENENDCAFIGHLMLDVRQSPIIEDTTEILCPNQESIVIGPGPGYVRYEWSTGETTETIVVTVPGTFEVTVFNGTDCTDTAIFTVERAPVPSPLEIVIQDFSNNNMITVEVGQPENYQYAINDGPRQDSNVFTGLSVGAYTVFIWDGECLVYEETVMIGGPPAYFTPNSDGFHDLWQITGRQQFSDAKIYIFDRFGKLLKQLTPLSDGWDGTYNGNPLPSSDYWYRIELGDGRMVSGHFTLKR